jgi:hypothetical protein
MFFKNTLLTIVTIVGLLASCSIHKYVTKKSFGIFKTNGSQIIDPIGIVFQTKDILRDWGLRCSNPTTLWRE